MGGPHPLYLSTGFSVSTSMIETFDSFLKRFAAGEIGNYTDLVFSGFITP
jgi:hypothetical protein